jgi:hypothetical protein
MVMENNELKIKDLRNCIDKAIKDVGYYGMTSKKDSALKSSVIGRYGAALNTLTFIYLTGRYGINVDPDTQAAIGDIIISALQVITGGAGAILPLISKWREGRK